MEKKDKFTAFSLFSAIIASLGGFLLGYNQTVIAGALMFIEKDFNLSTIQQEMIVSIMLIGALVGASFGGILADRIGRKLTLFFTTVFFVFSSMLLSSADTMFILIVGRFICGFAVGIVSIVAPLYIAEMSSPEHRGFLVSINQLSITLGILIAYIVSYIFADKSDWRSMFGSGLIPALGLFIGLFFLSETPSFLASRGNHVKAEKILKKIRKIRPDEEVLMKTQTSKEKVKWRHVFNKSIRPALVIGIGMSVIQQISGINGVIFYAPKIFQMSGFVMAEKAILASISIGVINVLSTIIAIWLIDIIGRRLLLIIGLCGMTASLAVLGFGFAFLKESVGMLALVCLIVYIAFFAISLGPVVWVLLSEIFPLGVRGRAMGLSVFINWVANYFVSLTLLTLLQNFGPGNTFWLYGLICILALWFVIAKVPETKGKSFVEIQHFLKKQFHK